jgi:hypothetical protein
VLSLLEEPPPVVETSVIESGSVLIWAAWGAEAFLYARSVTTTPTTSTPDPPGVFRGVVVGRIMKVVVVCSSSSSSSETKKRGRSASSTSCFHGGSKPKTCYHDHAMIFCFNFIYLN